MSSPTSSGPLAFYATPAHPCSYLADREAVTVFADPGYRKDRRLYTTLSQLGFRRSGAHVYRPHCPDCSACVPVRLSVSGFRPRRSQRRAWHANTDLEVRVVPPGFSPEHYALYARYVSSRHPGGGMDHPTPAQYLEFLTSAWSETLFYEFRADRALAAVAVVDRLEDGLSAVYTFYAPELAHRSLGTYAVLWEVEAARRLGLPWLYLGYWIRESPKMRYKSGYQPLEYFYDGHWRSIEPP
jgi:arginine-tRNA-protein transferase